jgi:hypothetical protein
LSSAAPANAGLLALVGWLATAQALTRPAICAGVVLAVVASGGCEG